MKAKGIGQRKQQCTVAATILYFAQNTGLLPPIAKRLKDVIISMREENNFRIIEMEVMPDHVHLLLDIDPGVGVDKVVACIKGRASNVLRQEFPELKTKLPDYGQGASLLPL